MKSVRLLIALLAALLFMPAVAAPEGYPVRGRVIDRNSRQPVPYASVVVSDAGNKGASTDSAGMFTIERVEPGIRRFVVSSLGYRTFLTSEYLVSAATPFIEVELEEDPGAIEAVTVTPSPFRRTVESPVAMHVIGVREIEKSPARTVTSRASCAPIPACRFHPWGTATT